MGLHDKVSQDRGPGIRDVIESEVACAVTERLPDSTGSALSARFWMLDMLVISMVADPTSLLLLAMVITSE